MSDPKQNEGSVFEHFVTFQVARAHQAMNIQAARLLEENAGLTLTQWRIVLTIGDGAVDTLSRVAEITLIDKGLLSRNLSTLIKRGLALSTPDPADRRINRISLSDRGRALHDKMLPIMTDRQKRLKRDLSPEEIRLLSQVMPKLERAAQDLGPWE